MERLLQDSCLRHVLLKRCNRFGVEQVGWYVVVCKRFDYNHIASVKLRLFCDLPERQNVHKELQCSANIWYAGKECWRHQYHMVCDFAVQPYLVSDYHA